ncbi:MAG: signal peptidase I [Halobacteriota archaeon]|nr:signal peptidase I [Halobacteriota archaeon]
MQEDLRVSKSTIIDLWDDLNKKNEGSWLSVLSGSMAPLLQIDDKVLIRSVKPDEIRFGDIVVFKDADRLVVHRVIRKYRSKDEGGLKFIQKGDATTNAEISSEEDVVGRVVSINKNDRVIEHNKGIWMLYNIFITLFSTSVYYLKPRNRTLKGISRYFFNIVRSCSNFILKRI